MINEIKVSGKKYRVWDETAKTWKRLSFWTKASDVEYDDNSTVKDQLDQLSPISTFVYNCTETNDSTAIATIINNFFNNGTAMTMNLVITGTMGISFTNNCAMYINATNTRGAVCNIDFSNCHIPNMPVVGNYMTPSVCDFLNISSSTVRLNVTGLVVGAPRYAIYINGSNNTFTNCKIYTTPGYGISQYLLYIYNGSNNTFTNCSFLSGGSYNVNIYGGGYNTFTDCAISDANGASSGAFYIQSPNTTCVNCYITSKSNHTIHLSIGSESSQFVNCLISNTGVYSSIYTNTNFANTNFTNCIISNTNSDVTTKCVWLNSTSYGIMNFTNCKITNKLGVAISVETSNTATVIKLIGCYIGGSTLYDVQQTSAASTVKWYIMGNSFSKSSQIINGTGAISYATASAYIYFPQYGNLFNQVI